MHTNSRLTPHWFPATSQLKLYSYPQTTPDNRLAMAPPRSPVSCHPWAWAYLADAQSHAEEPTGGMVDLPAASVGRLLLLWSLTIFTIHTRMAAQGRATTNTSPPPSSLPRTHSPHSTFNVHPILSLFHLQLCTSHACNHLVHG